MIKSTRNTDCEIPKHLCRLPAKILAVNEQNTEMERTVRD